MIKAAQDAGKLVIGVDSDQSALAPNAVLTSMVKRVDLAVWMATRDAMHGQFKGGDTVLGLKEAGVALAPVRLDFPGKEAAMLRIAALREAVVSGQISVPATITDLQRFVPPAPPVAAR